MSENIPESIPTSQDRRSQRPAKKARSNTPSSQQSSHINALFANPDRQVETSSPKAKTVAAPPEIVANVQGSSAGAGSGEFHVYKASRRREYERLRLMDEEVEKEEKDREFRDRQEDNKKKDDEKLSKNQAKRAKAKARKEKGKMLEKMQGMEVDGKEESKAEGDAGSGGVKKKLGAAKVALPKQDGDAGAEDGEMGTVDNGQSGQEEGGLTFHDDD